MYIAHTLTIALLSFIVWVSVPTSAGAAQIGLRLQAELTAASPSETLPVIIRLSEQLAPATYRHLSKKERRRQLVQELRSTSGRSQKGLRKLLARAGAGRIKDLWHINALALDADPALIAAIANLPEVASVSLDGLVALPSVQPAAVSTTEWNLAALGIFDLWPLLPGSPGDGIVVANIDVGVDATHANLQNWRAGLYDWFDPVRPTDTTDTPVDSDGHGTAVMGIMAGSNVGGSRIGIAPAAQWIATNPFATGSASFADLHASFAWVLDPDGDTNTDDAPDVVNNSWALLPDNRCSNEFQADINALKAAGIGVIFAAGNSGPNLFTSQPPGNDPNVVAVGATDSSGKIAGFSSRGPSPCSGTFPELVAPGVGIWTTLPGGYGTVDGTSFTAPHVSGVMALLMQAYPAASIRDLETAMTASAVDLGPVGPDSSYGYGQVQAMHAWRYLAGEPILSIHDPSAPENDHHLDFGNITPGVSQLQDLTLRNAGSADLLISAIDFSGLTTELTLESDLCSNATLVSGATCRVSLRFAPTAFTLYTASLTILSNDIDNGSIVVTLSGDGNTPPPAARLLTPADGAINVARPVTFSWLQAADADGDAITTALRISQSPDFSLSTPIPVVTATSGSGTVMLAGGGLLAVALLLRRRQLRCLQLLLAATALLFTLSCGGSDGGGVADDVISYEHDSLLADTAYYWKVQSTDADGAVAESVVYQFTTAL